MSSEPIARLLSIPLLDSALRRLRTADRDSINLHRSLAHAPAMLAPTWGTWFTGLGGLGGEEIKVPRKTYLNERKADAVRLHIDDPGRVVSDGCGAVEGFGVRVEGLGGGGR